jgi:hypothetical protein
LFDPLFLYITNYSATCLYGYEKEESRTIFAPEMDRRVVEIGISHKEYLCDSSKK